VAESFASSSTQTGRNDRPPTAGPVAFAVRTLGCKVNQVESEDITGELLARGCRLVAEDEAEVIVVNTCTVTAESDRKARKVIRHAAGLAQRPRVFVTGCLASVDPSAVEGLAERVISEADKGALPDRITAATSAPTPRRRGVTSHSRAMLKVQDGCDAHCAYCIVPHARGVPRSVPVQEVVARARVLVQGGAGEVVLTGVNLGRYESNGLRLPELVSAVAAAGVPRLRLSSIEPQDVSQGLLAVLSRTPAACPHLHVPLQSGSDAVLARMGRLYTPDQYESCIGAARSAVPGLVVTTDVMAGFPGESEADAATTREFCARIGFSRLHVFRYSPRPGTPAAAMSDQVPAETRSRRAAALRELDAELRKRYVSGRLGQDASLLVERVVAGPHGPVALGTTEDYLKVRCDCGGAEAGQVMDVRLRGCEDGTVCAEPI